MNEFGEPFFLPSEEQIGKIVSFSVPSVFLVSLIHYPQIPWKHVMGIRDIIVHHYFDVDADEIYRICKEDIMPLYQVIKQIMNDLR